jgi:hypothetical protein
VLVLAFPEGGTFPFAASSFLPAFAAGVGVAALAPRGPVRTGGALYALLCLAAFVVPSPLGGNAARLGALLAAPLAFLLLWPQRRAVALALVVPVAYWVVQPAVRDVRRAQGDPAARAAFHQPLLAFLRERGDTRRVRIEIPLTSSFGEARFVSPHVALARGWERQLDRQRNALFYDDRPLTAERYARWLREKAIAYVALPVGVPLDASARAERALLEREPAFLEEVGRPGRWRVWAVRDAAPLAGGGARLDRLGADGFTLTAPRAGTFTIRVAFTPYWVPTSGRGCIRPAPGGWTQVRTRAAGRLTAATRFAPGRVRASSPRCR